MRITKEDYQERGDQAMSHRIIEESSNTGAVLRVLAVGFRSIVAAEDYAIDGLGADE